MFWRADGDRICNVCHSLTHICLEGENDPKAVHVSSVAYIETSGKKEIYVNYTYDYVLK